ncbi:MAG: FadR/GntR family transcriptional regulator [Pseudomonadota bacterium]
MNSNQIASDLRDKIVEGALSVGTRLPPERSLAMEFGVARGTVREALRQLEHLRFVERRAGSGTYVIWAENDDSLAMTEGTRPLELLDARFGLEPQLCRLAVIHATAQDLQALEEPIRVMESCLSDRTSFADADERFHLALADCAQNPLMRWMMAKMHEVRSHKQWGHMRTLTLTPQMIALYNRQHRTIVEAIRARDADAAARAMRNHLVSSRQSLIDVTN